MVCDLVCRCNFCEYTQFLLGILLRNNIDDRVRIGRANLDFLHTALGANGGMVYKHIDSFLYTYYVDLIIHGTLVFWSSVLLEREVEYSYRTTPKNFPCIHMSGFYNKCL